MDPQAVLRPNHPIQTHLVFTSEPYTKWRFGLIANLDYQFGNNSIWTRTQIWPDSQELLLTLTATNSQIKYLTYKNKNHSSTVDADFQNLAGSVSLSLMLMKVACTVFMNVCNQSPLRYPLMQVQTSLTLHWLSFSTRGREYVTLSLDYKGGQYITKRQWHSKVNNLRLTVGYLDATRIRHTHNPELKRGSNWSTKSRQIPHVDRYRYRFGPLQCRKSVCLTYLEQHKIIFAVSTRTPGGLAGTVNNSISNIPQAIAWEASDTISAPI
jgi:hypothetical protein